MGGKVLRRAGAALLAAVFMATIPARGQTPAGNQTVTHEASALSLQGLVAASRENGVSAANGLDFISFENTASTENSLVSTSFENAASFDKGLTPEGVSYIFDSYAADRYISDSGDAELPDAPARAAFSSAAAAPEDQSATYEAMTGRERLGWIVKNTLWPEHLAGGVITSAAGTGLNRPREDGPHWGGFGERFGAADGRGDEQCDGGRDWRVVGRGPALFLGAGIFVSRAREECDCDDVFGAASGWEFPAGLCAVHRVFGQ